MITWTSSQLASVRQASGPTSRPRLRSDIGPNKWVIVLRSKSPTGLRTSALSDANDLVAAVALGMNKRAQKKWRSALGDLLHIMARLRSPKGCPWDREQDHKS